MQNFLIIIDPMIIIHSEQLFNLSSLKLKQ